MPHAGVVGRDRSQLDGSGLRIVIVHTRWNSEIVDALTHQAIQQLRELGVRPDDVYVQSVPGAYELPFGVKSALGRGTYHAAIAIGVLIKGETMHFEYIAEAATSGLMRVGLDRNIPVVFGVLTCLTDEQARMRAGIGGSMKNEGHNHAKDWGEAAVEMALINRGTLLPVCSANTGSR